MIRKIFVVQISLPAVKLGVYNDAWIFVPGSALRDTGTYCSLRIQGEDLQDHRRDKILLIYSPSPSFIFFPCG